QTSSAGTSQQLSSGNTSSLAVAKYSSSGIFITGMQTSSAGASQQLSSGNTSSLAVAKYSSSEIFITGSRNDLNHFIPNNPPPNLMLHL
nr:hypothetical protein [Tanacetum cinerariifolium]